MNPNKEIIMIVEAAVLGVILFKTIIAPIKGAWIATKLIEASVGARKGTVINEEGKVLSFFFDDLVDDEGKVHTDYLCGAVKVDGKLISVLLTRSEVELLQEKDFLEAAVRYGVPLGPDTVQKLMEAIERREGEISRTKSRRVTVSEKTVKKTLNNIKKKMM
jgi:hypothetical protein